ncbi:MAG: hypothetical protein HQK83_04460 [Fibrobacteria bacterium]|nr:hypothetical protein [Fibrobacteria bacterium]
MVRLIRTSARFVCVALIALISFSCISDIVGKSDNSSDTGGIAPNILFKKTAPAIDVPSAVVTVRLLVKTPKIDTSVSVPYSAHYCEISSIPVGVANFSVEGLDFNDDVIYRADTLVEIIENQTISPTVKLESTKPIMLLFTSPQDGSSVGTQSLTVSGITYSDFDIVVFKMDGTDLGITGNQWSRTVELDTGLNKFGFFAVNTNGDILNDTLKVSFYENVVDETAPLITFTQPKDGDTISVQNITLIGTVSDASGVLSLMIDNNNATISATTWSYGVTLQEGANAFSISAVDNSSAANTSQKTLTIHYNPTVVDNEPPYIKIDNPGEGDTVSNASTLISGTALDNSGLASVKVNNQIASLNSEGKWTRTVTLTYGSNTIIAVGVDNAAGSNTSSDTITVVYDTTIVDITPPVVEITSPSNNAVVSSSIGVQIKGKANDGSGIANVYVNGIKAAFSNEEWSASITLSDTGANIIKVIATDLNDNKDSASISVIYNPEAEDKTPPSMTLVSPQTSVAEVATNSYLVRVSATDIQSGVASVTINNNSATLNSETYEYTVSLQQGDNNIQIIAVDNSSGANKDTMDIIIKYDPSLSDIDPPVIILKSHRSGETMSLAEQLIRMDVTDAQSGVLSVMVNGTAANLNTGKYEKAVVLTEGSNSFKIIASDNSSRKNKDTLDITLIYDGSNGLVAYYPFNGNANDESVNTNNGEVNGAALTEDRFGNADKAYSFDGTDDLINCGNDGSLALTKSISIILWINPDSILKGSLIDRGSWFARPGYAIYFFGDSLGMRFKDNDTTSTSNFLSKKMGVGKQDVWQQVAFTWDMSTTNLKIYMNSELKGTNNYSENIGVLNGDLLIGKPNMSNEIFYYKGQMDDIYIYDRALSSTEIDSLYHLGGWPATADPTKYLVDSRDDQVYKKVTIGTQTWMAENLNYEPSSGNSWCYDNNSSNCVTYGRLYDWNTAVADNHGNGYDVCPEGWHLSSDNEWKTLEMAIGMTKAEADSTGYRGTIEGQELKSISWGGTDIHGFSVLPAGRRYGGDNEFVDNGNLACFLTGTSYLPSTIRIRTIGTTNNGVYRSSSTDVWGYSIRCIKGEYLNNPPTVPSPSSPLNNATNQETNINLTWSGSDPDGDALIYDVFLGTNNPPITKVSNGQSNAIYSATSLSNSTTYFWYVVANDGSATTQSSVRSFTVKPSPWTCGDSLITDSRDGKTYQTTLIGTQCWMAENLNYDTADAVGSWCFENTLSFCNTFGRLYNWNTAMAGATSSDLNPSGVKGICPEGSHLPSKTEWKNLENFTGDQSIAGEKLKATSFDGGTNNFGFTALPSGFRNTDGSFRGIDSSAYFWSTTHVVSYQWAWYHSLQLGKDNMIFVGDWDSRGYSIRCIKDLD